MQLRMVGRRIREGSATILGDLAQATGLWRYSSWDEISAHLDIAETAELEEMTLAYRVPREIMDIALPVLELTAPSIRPPRAFRDGGEAPVWVETSRADRAGEAIDLAVAAHARGGTAGIIAPASLLGDVRSEFERRDLEFGDAARGELVGSIELLQPTASKGLEFDHVVLLEPAAIIREAAEGQGHRELYVALTRATRSLACVHCEPLPWPLGQHAAPTTPAIQDAVGTTAAEPPTAESPTLVAAGGEPAPPVISLGEALVLAGLRGIDLDEALAAALLARAAGASEAEAAAVLLGTPGAGGSRIEELLAKARDLAEADRESDA